MNQICNYFECTGCFACLNICPKGAISEFEDEFGCNVPHIDPDKCIDCGLCIKVCPSNTIPKLKRADCSYAVYSRDAVDKKYSSSGGAASVMSRKILDEGGCVFGASCVDGTTEHICIESINDIHKLRGSKYVQSRIGMSYSHAKQLLDEDKKVLFTGTPCQIAGLMAYLGKDYENLIAVDLICHGTPPHKYLKEHINTIIKGKDWNRYTFRGEHDYKLAVYNNDKIIFKADRWQDEYFYAFLEGMSCRESCYTCKYSRIERVSDITIGDFWGLDKQTMKVPYEGRISLILPNTYKGRRFFDECKDDFVWEQRTIQEAAHPTQCNLIHPSIRHKDREQFLENYLKYGFTKSVKMTSLGKEIIKEKTIDKLKLRKIKSLAYRLVKKLK